MNLPQSNLPIARQRRFFGPGLFVMTLLFVAGLARQAAAQTFTLTNIWNIAAGTDGLSSGSDGGNRGIAYSPVSNQVFVAYRAGGSNLPVMVFDGTAGTWLSGASGVNGSLGLNLDQIGCGDDGTLYGCPLNTGVTGTSAFKLYSWTNWNTAPYLCFSNSASDPIVTAINGTRRIGDSLAVRGSGTNTLIIAGVPTTGAFVLFSTTDGVNFTSTVLTNSAIGALPNVFGICFYTNNTFLIKASGNCTLLQYPTNFASQSSPVTATVLGSAALSGTTGDSSLSYSTAGQLLGATSQSSGSTGPVTLYSLTNFPTAANNVASTSFACTSGNNGNETGGTALGGTGKTNWLYAMGTDNGLHAYQIQFTVAPVAPNITTQPASAIGAFAPQTLTIAESGTAPITNIWYSNTSSNSTGGTFVQSSTNTFFTVNTASTNYYYVIATNIAGGQTSSVVELALIPATTNSVVSNLFSIPPGTGTFPFEANDDNTRGLAYDAVTGHLVIANKSGGAHLYLIDGTNGTNIGQMNTSGMYTGGTFPIDQVVVADDGVVYAGNLALTASVQSFNLTSWPSATTNSTLYNAYPAGDPGSGSGDRWGDTMAARGSGVNTQILLGSRGTNVALLTTGNGTDFNATLIPVPGVPNSFAGYGIAFGAGNTFWAKNYLGDLYEISFDPTLASNAAIVLDYVSAGNAQIPSHMVGVGVDTVHSILGGVVLNDQNPDLQLFQLTGNANPPVLFDQAFFPAYNPSANGNNLGVVSMKYPRVYAMDVDLGIIGATYGVPASTPPTASLTGATIYASGSPYTLTPAVTGTLPLYYQWQYNTVSNLATAVNIPGATSGSYTFNPPVVTNTGWYDVIVTNFGGGTTSAPVLLTVLAPVTSPYVTNVWKLAAGGSNVSFLDTSSYGTRGLAYDSNSGALLLANHLTTNITVLNASNGAINNSITINTLGMPVGTFVLDQIAVADDGILYAGNLALEPGDTFALTAWNNVGNSGASEYQAYLGDPGAGSGDRWGDTMAIRGSGMNTQILLGSYGQGYGPGTSVALLTTTDGMNFTSLNIPVSGVPAGFAGLGIAFGAGNTFWAKGGHNYDLRQVSFDPNNVNPAVILQDYVASNQIPNDLTGLGVDAGNNILIGTCFNDAPNDLQFYQLTGTTNSPILFDQDFYLSSNPNSQENAVAVIKFPWAFGLNVNNGVVAVRYAVPPPIAPSFSVTATRVGGTVVLSWTSAAGHTYNVLSSSTLTTARSTWTTNSSQAGTGGTLSYTNSSPTGKLFYAIQAQ